MQIPHPSLVRTLHGVAQATKSTEAEMEPAAQLLSSAASSLSSSNDTLRTDKDAMNAALSFDDWHSAIKSNPTNADETSLHLASLALAISFLRETCRQNQPASARDLEKCWTIIHAVLLTSASSSSKTEDLCRRTLFSASRSAQGLLSVPLSSILKDGSIDELFRLHVWMPDGKRGNPDFLLHSHQPFAQSWILAGEGLDHAYRVDAVVDDADADADAKVATHAGYAIAWNGSGGGSGSSSSGSADYKTHQSCSVVRNTGRLFRACEVATRRHVRGDSYCVPAAAFHTTEVAPDALHATLFFFDAHRGFVRDAGVLGPPGGESYTQLRDPAGVTPVELAEAVEAVRRREVLAEEARDGV